MLNQLLDDINTIAWPVMLSRAATLIGFWLAEWIWGRSNNRWERLGCGDCEAFLTADYCGRINGKPHYDCHVAASHLDEEYWWVNRDTYACSQFMAAEPAKKEQ